MARENPPFMYIYIIIYIEFDDFTICYIILQFNLHSESFGDDFPLPWRIRPVKWRVDPPKED